MIDTALLTTRIETGDSPMSVKRWQQILALLPCERCSWMPPDCTCRTGRPASAPPLVSKPGGQLRVLTLDERRAAYSSLPVLDVIAAVAAEQTDERKDGAA